MCLERSKVDCRTRHTAVLHDMYGMIGRRRAANMCTTGTCVRPENSDLSTILELSLHSSRGGQHKHSHESSASTPHTHLHGDSLLPTRSVSLCAVLCVSLLSLQYVFYGAPPSYLSYIVEILSRLPLLAPLGMYCRATNTLDTDPGHQR